MIIEKDGTIVTVHTHDSTRFEQQTESIKSMIRRADGLSYSIEEFLCHWKLTCEILEVEDLLKHGRTEVDITTDKDFLRKIEILASEIYDVRSILKRLLVWLLQALLMRKKLGRYMCHHTTVTKWPTNFLSRDIQWLFINHSVKFLRALKKLLRR